MSRKTKDKGRGEVTVTGNVYPSGGQAGEIIDTRGVCKTLVPAKRGGAAAMPIIEEGVERSILAPDNFQHKAGDGTSTRKRRKTNTVPALQAQAGHTQASYVLEEQKATPSGMVIEGNLKGEGGHECHNVYGVEGVAPTVRQNHGKITMITEYGKEGIAPTLPAKGRGNTGTNTPMVLEEGGSSSSSRGSGASASDSSARDGSASGQTNGTQKRAKSTGSALAADEGPRILEDFYPGRKPREYQTEAPALRSSHEVLKVEEGRPKIVEDFYKGRKQREYASEAPTLRSGRQGLKVEEPTATGVNYPSRGMEPRKDGLACTIKAQPTGNKNLILLKEHPTAVKGDLMTRRNPTKQAGLQEKEEMFTLRVGAVHGVMEPNHPGGNVWAENSSPKETSAKSTQKTSRTTSSSSAGSHVRLSAWLENEGGSQTPVGRFFTKSLVSQSEKRPSTFSLRTLRDSSAQKLKSAQESIERLKGEDRGSLLSIVEESKTNPKEAGKKLQSLLEKVTASSQFSIGFMTSGTVLSGVCSTQRITGYLRTGRECSLLDVLETSVPEKYYLKGETVEKLLAYDRRQKENGRGFGFKPNDPEGTAAALKIGGSGCDDTVDVFKQTSFDGSRADGGFRKSEGIVPTLTSQMGTGGNNVPMVKDRPSMVGLLQQTCVKRANDTPKEINQFLKDSRKAKAMPIDDIAERLGIPKTQAEHYFRTDKCRAVPSPETWAKLKELLGFGDDHDKAVTEVYEKEIEFEQTRRVYAGEGVSPTLNATQEPIVRESEKALLVSQEPRACLTPDRTEKRQHGRRFKENGEEMFTLTGQDVHGVEVYENPSGTRTVGSPATPEVGEAHRVYDESGKSPPVKASTINVAEDAGMKVANPVTPDAYLARGERRRNDDGKAVLTSMHERRIRRLTPTECEALQGFPRNWTEYGVDKEGNVVKQSDTSRYKMMGNAVTVNVIQQLAKRFNEILGEK